MLFQVYEAQIPPHRNPSGLWSSTPFWESVGSDQHESSHCENKKTESKHQAAALACDPAHTVFVVVLFF